jgi:DNA polymerase-3 subunit alpha
MGYVDHLLIAWDVVRYAREKGLFVGAGRGAVPGSLVNYVLHITDVDPTEYGLIFERFFNPERTTMLDMYLDTDLCIERREEVIAYVREKYGEDLIALFTARFPEYTAKDPGMLNIYFLSEYALSVIRDALQMIEGNHGVKIVFSTMRYDDPMVFELIAKNNSGLVNLEMAKGVLSCNQNVFEVIDEDFTHLRDVALTRLIDAALMRLMEYVNMDNLEDRAIILEILRRSSIEDRAAIIEFFHPNGIEDIAAIIALFRPGSFQFIGDYVENKKHPDRIHYAHPCLEPILSVTYGVIVYQEQIMDILHHLAGYSYGHSDLVRRVMSRKKEEDMRRERDCFINGVTQHGVKTAAGCVANGVSADVAEKVFDQMAWNAEYAFCKSHAIAHAITVYRAAWLELHYPVEYAAALTLKREPDVIYS